MNTVDRKELVERIKNLLYHAVEGRWMAMRMIIHSLEKDEKLDWEQAEAFRHLVANMERVESGEELTL